MSYLALSLLQEDGVRVLEGAPDGGHRVLGVVHVADDALKEKLNLNFAPNLVPETEDLTVWRWEEAKAAASLPACPSNTA